MADIVRRGDYPTTEWDPVRSMREMLRWDPFRAAGYLPRFEREGWAPCFEVRENGTNLRFIADIPGVKRDDLDISVSGNRMTISGKRELEERGKGESLYEYERPFGQFTRTFVLSDNVDVEHITSDLCDGVLTIVVPRTAASKTRKITVGA